MPSRTDRITAVLGPTNTGKTHYAIERMLGHETGVIGLPLRLLAREVYDRIATLRGPSVVALVTGEERIVPDRARYWVCTVEAMPQGLGADFLAIDEIQLCADPERGHVFTDRLLRARGSRETLFLGADAMRGAIAVEVPSAGFLARPRFSDLTYAGSCKISRMPRRSAIVGFSVDSVYAIAEAIRRLKGGAAVVMGALSPRTRNAQVELYQNGDVDYLVATDAIGMGLNLDIDHVAFFSTRKFDSRRMRDLTPIELAQIAGRAGRHMNDGTFGVTGEAAPLDENVAKAIMAHRFAPIRRLQWRNPEIEFASIESLAASLEAGADDPWLVRAREADDLLALRALADLREIRDRCRSERDVRLLWDVCRIPDFRGIGSAEHAGLLRSIFEFLHGRGRVPDDWLAAQVARTDRVDGDIDALSRRLAHIRTWTYVAQREGWAEDETRWRESTRAIEDRLSDALHERLTQRFVDRRTSVLLRRLKDKESLVAEVNDKGEVTVEDQFVGRLEGFRFRQDSSAGPDEAKTLRRAAQQALRPEFRLRADRFYNAPDTEIDFTDQGGLMWGENAVGKLVAGADALKPQVEAFVDEEAEPDVVQKVQRRLQHFIDRRIAALFEPLANMQRDEALAGLARGFAFRLVEGLGVLSREKVADEVRNLDQEARGALRKHGVRFGQYTIFVPILLKPAPTRLRLVLWSLANGLRVFPESPPPGLVTVPTDGNAADGYHLMSGYRASGKRAIRVDMLERLADLLRGEDGRNGFEASPDMLSISGLSLEQFADLMRGLGYKCEKGERARRKPEEVMAEKPADAGDGERSPPPQQAVSAQDDAVDESDSNASGENSAPATMPETGSSDAEGGARVDAEPTSQAEDAPGDGAEADALAVSDAGEAEARSDLPAEEAAASDELADGTAAPETRSVSSPENEAAPDAAAADEGGDDASIDAAEQGEDDSETASGEPGEADSETEVFYTFAWARSSRRRDESRQDRTKNRGRPEEGRRGKKGKPGSGKGERAPKQKGAGDKPRRFEARPPREEKPVDPDNPFVAALMGLKEKS